MKPRVRTAEGLLHLKYKLPQRIYTSNIYPRTSPNGSNVIVIGHEKGISVLWRGGKHHKARSEANGNPHDSEDAMDTRVDEEEDEHQSLEFEDEPEEFDPAKPYQSIVQHTDLDLGTGVLHIAFPRLPRTSATKLTPQLLEERMLIALACTDSSIRLLTIPLAPPNMDRIHQGLYKEDFQSAFERRADWIDSLITVPSAQCHRSLPKGISIALTQRSLDSVEGDDADTVDTDTSKELEQWEVLIASYSADLSGKMLIHRIPVSQDGQDIEQPPTDEILWRSERLSGPAASIQILAPAVPAAQRSSSDLTTSDNPRVLVAMETGPVRVYECSSENTDRGYWSITLYPGYGTSNNVTIQRKILDAQWVLGGHAICVLVEDGEWGIWDLLPSRIHTTISGKNITKFNLGGWLNSNSTTAQKHSAQPKPESRSSLAPMTPNTRKVKQDTLFSKSSTPTGNSSPAAIRGGISPQLTIQSLSGIDDDESLLLWHCDKTILIASLRSYFNTRKNVHDFFSSSPGSQAREMPSVIGDMPGEQTLGAAIFPVDETTGPSAIRGKIQDLFVVGEKSFVIVANPLSEPPKKKTATPSPQESSNVGNNVVDQALLDQGDLGVDGLDRMLQDMASDSPSRSPTKRRVGFAA